MSPSEPSLHLVLTTAASREAAETLARTLLERRLVVDWVRIRGGVFNLEECPDGELNMPRSGEEDEDEEEEKAQAFPRHSHQERRSEAPAKACPQRSLLLVPLPFIFCSISIS